jgi:hypothetical protein
MADENDYFIPDQVEEQVARLRQSSASRTGQDAPEERQLIDDLQRLYEHERADARSLQTVWSRLEGQAVAGSERLPAVVPAPGLAGRVRPRRVVSLFSVVAAVLIIIVVVTAIVVSRALPNTGTAPAGGGSPMPTTQPTETLYKPNPGDYFGVIRMLSSAEGWIIGDTYSAPTGTQPSNSEALILHYHNGQWLRVPPPSNAFLGVPNTLLSSISMLSVDEGWAVGYGYPPSRGNAVPSSFILHYTGGRWARDGGLLRNVALDQVQMLSPTDGWASGGGGFTGGAEGATTSVMLHYDGRSWTPVQTPPVSSIKSLEMLSPTDGWAAAEDTILHYDGQQWTIFQVVPQVFNLSMDSASDGWAVGLALYGITGSLFWHYNGRQWVQVLFPNSSPSVTDVAQTLSMDSPTDGWAVGLEDTTAPLPISLYLHYSRGHWTKVPGPNLGILMSVSMVSANEGWALNGGGLLHYLNGIWSQYHF